MTISSSAQGISYTNTAPNSSISAPPMVAGRVYLAGMPNNSFTTTNATPIPDSTIRGSFVVINSRITITQVGFQTSSSNASVGGAVKIGIYRVDQTTLLPSTLVAQSGAIAVTDSAASTTFQGALTSSTTVDAGVYFFCVMGTGSPGVRLTLINSVVPNFVLTGAAPAGSPDMSSIYTGTSQLTGYDAAGTYASGFPSTFPSATPIVGTTPYALSFRT